jgi:general secretion pathway protein G
MRTSAIQGLRKSEAGMTLLELILACAILMILSTAALPMARFTVMRLRERELRADLLAMRDAIDRYKDLADRNLIRVELGSNHYPPNLETLVKPIPLGSIGIGGAPGAAGKNILLLRRIPIDPITGKADWGLRAVQDDLDSRSWGGGNVFDVYSQSKGTAMNGTKYSDW